MGNSHDARKAMACHYEAGRALAYWWGGVGSQTVVLGGTGTVPALAGAAGADALGRFIRYENYKVDPVANSLQTPDWIRWGRMEIALVTCYAGSVAWARLRKRTIESCLATDGRADAEMAETISEDHFSRPKPCGSSAAFCRASALKYATLLVRSRQGWAAISSMAEALAERGRLEAGDIDASCFAAFGVRPLPPGWDPHWPPALDFLTDGYMPQAYWPWYWDEDFRDADGVWIPALPNPFLTGSPAPAPILA